MNTKIMYIGDLVMPIHKSSRLIHTCLKSTKDCDHMFNFKILTKWKYYINISIEHEAIYKKIKI